MAFEGKVALITGAGSGMGQLAAWRLAAAGVKVAALDINAKGLAQTAEGKPNIKTYVLDVTSTEAVNQTVASVEQELGPIDRVINAAAIMPFGKLLDQPTEQIHRLMAINFGGLVNITKATLPGMLKRGKGDFIGFSSMLGQMPTLMTGGYAATKFAVSCFTEVLYHENRNKGVRFVCVCPPAVKTPLLQQAVDTVWPKILDGNPPIKPEEVLDALEVSLEKGEFWCMPGKNTRLGYVMRRLLPDAVWKNIHKVEGF